MFAIEFEKVVLQLRDRIRKFKLPAVYQTTNKTVRWPNDIIEDIKELTKGTNCSFSAFVIEAVRVAIENLKEENEEIQ